MLRSKGAALTVDYDHYDVMGEYFLECVGRHVSRWRRADLSFNVEQFAEGVPLLLEHPADLLEQLEISVPPMRGPGPIKLFAGVTPRLKVLTLLMDSLLLNSPIFNGLTSLHLNGVAEPSNSLSDLLHILTANPDLQDLSLVDLTLSSDSTLEAPSSIQFPKLQKLSLSLEPIHTTRALIERIKAKDVLSVNLTCKFRAGEGLDVIFDPLPQFIVSAIKKSMSQSSSRTQLELWDDGATFEKTAAISDCHPRSFNIELSRIDAIDAFNRFLDILVGTIIKGEAHLWLNQSQPQGYSDEHINRLCGILGRLSFVTALYMGRRRAGTQPILRFLSQSQMQVANRITGKFGIWSAIDMAWKRVAPIFAKEKGLIPPCSLGNSNFSPFQAGGEIALRWGTSSALYEPGSTTEDELEEESEDEDEGDEETEEIVEEETVYLG